MIRIVKICFLLFLPALVLFGCKTKEKDVWKDTKITDIPPAKFDGLSGVEMVQAANFDIFVFEIPQDGLEQLDGVWKMLNKRGIHFLDYRAFSSNSFQVGLGRVAMSKSIDTVIQEAEGRMVNKNTLLIPKGKSEDVEAAFLDKPQSVFHLSTDGSVSGNVLGPGHIIMRLLAKDIPNITGVSNVQFSIVFSPPSTTLDALEIRASSGEYLFMPVLFNANLRSGDLIVMGPEELNNNPSTLDGLFFKENGNFFRLYLIVCRGVPF
ncbi:MAG: hypothetical protein ACYSUK_01100 [Planctomycetota bacterium]|jgi:hypothetical protein